MAQVREGGGYVAHVLVTHVDAVHVHHLHETVCPLKITDVVPMKAAAMEKTISLPTLCLDTVGDVFIGRARRS